MDEITKSISILTENDVRYNRTANSLPLPRTVAEVATERLEEKKLEFRAPKTGYSELDTLIKGFIPGHLYTLTGNENVGKTTISANFAVRVARQHKKVLYFALEPENTISEYLASVEKDKRFDELIEEDIMFDNGFIHIYGKQDVGDLEKLVQVIEHSQRYDLIIIDHIGYFIKGNRDVNTEQSNAIKTLASLAKRKQCAVMMIAHLRKRPSGQRKNYVPSSDDISGSGAFKQDSTEVLIIVRKLDDENDENCRVLSDIGELHVTKTKCGPNGVIDLHFEAGKAIIKSSHDLGHFSGGGQSYSGAVYLDKITGDYDPREDAIDSDDDNLKVFES